MKTGSSSISALILFLMFVVSQDLLTDADQSVLALNIRNVMKRDCEFLRFGNEKSILIDTLLWSCSLPVKPESMSFAYREAERSV
ncbi:MAG: hypothetical protein A2987_07350 [Omnitrophica bacterium RIFCSPLOWO2_01_FULL_45_10]|nr:MAG: hypothetical protein A2987_07350 [Omnitrophica bacterium RIFCSPLOWO2_01_FULL_45_10]